MILCGRGWGKNWTGANWINECAESGEDHHIALLGRDAHDVRAFMIEGPSGILQQAPPHFVPIYEPSKKLITWPNGCKGHIYYAEEPKTIRGPNHSKAWCDEIASWQDANVGDSEDTAWSNLMMTMRVGNPRILVTGTPKPLKLVKQLIRYPGVRLVRGRTLDNRANLSEVFFNNVVAKYVGTRLGRQELAGEILDDNPGASVHREWIEEARIRLVPQEFDRIVVAVDPSVAGTYEEGDDVNLAKPGAECGIVVCGKRGKDFYVLEDRTIKGSPDEWSKAVVVAYRYWLADCIVAERNNGGALVEAVIRHEDENANVETVWASKGKVTRLDPIAALYEQRRIHHIGTEFEALEDQLCQWEPIDQSTGKANPSPDRLDACVWGISFLAEVDQELTEGTSDQYENFWSRGEQSALW